MFHKGARATGSNLKDIENDKISKLFDEFIQITLSKSSEKNLKPAEVRSLSPCNLAIILDSLNLWVIAENHNGMPTTRSYNHKNDSFKIADIEKAAVYEFVFKEPFIIKYPVVLLEQGTEERKARLTEIAESHIVSEQERSQSMGLTTVESSVFASINYQLNPKLAFVFMPFTDELTGIYQEFIKPAVEASKFNLDCKRADDIRSNIAVINDIWRSIHEARIIIADLTHLNPNVMYELGLAHGLSKEVILIYQNFSGETRIPFDIAHIRRIEYEDTTDGKQCLKKKLTKTINNVLDLKIQSTNSIAYNTHLSAS